MDALHLAVEDGIGVDHEARALLEPLCEANFGCALGRAESVLESRVFGHGYDVLEQGEVGDPVIADRLREEAGEVGVREQQPASGGYAVGLVVESLGEDLGQVGDDGGAEEPGVDLGDTVGAVRADDGEVGHPDAFFRAFGDQADA